MTDRVRITLKVDPITHAVTRDGMPIDLGPDTTLEAGDGRMRTLQDIVDAYANATEFDDVADALSADVQQAVGELLFAAVGADGFANGLCRWLEIAIDDLPRGHKRHFLERLPWSLIARPDCQGFLVQDESGPWVITIDADPGGPKIEQLFPPEPKLLLILPEFPGDTQGGEHRAEIMEMLRLFYRETALNENVRSASTWPEIYKILCKDSSFDPQIIYFYGHGKTTTDGDSVFILDPVQNQLNEVGAIQFRDVLSTLWSGRRPAVFFGNCCHGASAARTSIGLDLGKLVSCVIANRTVADVQAAREFGIEILRSLVRDSAPPDRFMATATANVIGKVAGAKVGGRWACPVVYTNYKRWVALAPSRLRDPKLASAGDFVERIDRIALAPPKRHSEGDVPDLCRSEPLAATVEVIEPILVTRGISLSAVVWQAETRQGVECFGRRIRDEFLERFTTKTIRSLLVDLQADAIAHSGGGRRAHVLASLFVALAKPADKRLNAQVKVKTTDVLEVLTNHLTTAGIILLLRLAPIRIDDEASQALIKSYWQLWIDLRNELARTSDPAQSLRIVLGIGLDVAPGRRVEIETLLPAPADLGQTAHVIDLGTLQSIETSHLVKHFTDFASAYDDIASNERADRAAMICQETEGVFMPTQLVLKAEAGLT